MPIKLNNHMKRFYCILFLVCTVMVNSQHRLKINAATTVLGFPSIGYEKLIGTHFGFHVDAIGSLFNQYNHMPLKFLIITPEFRYYPKKGQTGFFVGGHIGGSTFELQKYNYANSSLYQEGYNYMLGISLGYYVPIAKNMALEAFVGGGSIQSFYNGYDAATGQRYEGTIHYNKSGEWLPYRGGLNVIWKL